MLLLILLNLFLYYCVLRLIRKGFFFQSRRNTSSSMWNFLKKRHRLSMESANSLQMPIGQQVYDSDYWSKTSSYKSNNRVPYNRQPTATHGDPGDSIRMAVQDKRKALQKLRLSNTFEPPVSDDSPRDSTNSGGNLFQDNKV